MTKTAQILFATCALVGLVSGVLAVGLLWAMVTRPLLVAQIVAGLS